MGNLITLGHTATNEPITITQPTEHKLQAMRREVLTMRHSNHVWIFNHGQMARAVGTIQRLNPTVDLTTANQIASKYLFPLGSV